MSYLRWSFSSWYVFAHCNGGLAVWSVHDDSDEPRLPCYTNEEVADFLTAKRPMSDIPGWVMTPASEKDLLLIAMREFLAEEAEEEVPTLVKIVRDIAKSGPCPMCGAEKDPP